LLPIVGVIILVSFIPVGLEWMRHRRNRREEPSP